MLLGVAAFFVHGLVRGLVAVTAVVSAVPTLLLALRCLVLPQRPSWNGGAGSPPCAAPSR